MGKHSLLGLLGVASSIATLPGAILESGLIQDLDASSGVVESGGTGTGVTSWANSAASGGDDLVTNRGSVTLSTAGSFPFLTLETGTSARMVGDDDSAFNSLLGGAGHTWFAVVRAAEFSNSGNKNAIFGTLTEGFGFTGVVAHASNGVAGYLNRPFADNFTLGTTSIVDGQWHIVAGRLSAGTGTQSADVFVDGPAAEASNSVSIPGTSGVGALAVGAERIGGGEDYEGDIARILVYDRPLTDSEINLVGAELSELYAINGSFVVPEVSSALLISIAGLMSAFARRRR